MGCVDPWSATILFGPNVEKDYDEISLKIILSNRITFFKLDLVIQYAVRISDSVKERMTISRDMDGLELASV